MKMVRFKALFAMIMAVVLMVSSVPTYTFAAADDTYYPLTVSGFNIDVVADTKNYSALQSQGCLEGGHCYFSSAVSSSGYYPSGATISTSSGKKFKMRASTENNSLQLTSGNRTGTLTLASPGVYSKLAVLVTGGGGPTNATATVIYTDGTQSASTTITAYDWYSHHQSEVYGSLYRMRINISGFMRGSIDSGSYSGMYEGVISGLDTSKEVSAVRFNWTSGNYFNAFAVSGVIGANEHLHDKLSFKQWTSTNSLPTEAGSYVLTSDVTISSTWNVPSGKVNLCLNGHGITRTNASGTTGSVINVGSGAKLNLYDCGTTERYYKVASPTVNGAGLGSIVSKSTYDSLSENERGTFTGGYITGGVIDGNLDNQHLIGGGVNVDGGSFTMNGGTIFGNKVCINAGAVKVKGAGASFTMNGGALLANYNDCYGGAISVGDNNASRLCTVNINGGTIARNWSGRNAGALHVDGYGHTVNITGGNIVNNYTNGNYESAGRGGGAIMKDGANFSLSGNVVIKDNMRSGGIEDNLVFRNSNDNISLSSRLGDDAEVGVYYRALSASSDKLVATNAQKDDLKHIHYDIPSEGTVVFCDGTKDWAYANGNIILIIGTHHTHTANTLWASAIVPTASVEKDSEDEILYSDFNSAFNVWKANSGSTLKLLKDAELTSNPGFFYDAGEWTLDLNGKTLKVKGTNFISASGVEGSEKGQGAVINIDDTSKDGNGKIDGNNTLTDENLLYVNNGGTLNLKKGTITNFNQSWGTILVKDNGTVNIYDGFTISGNKSNTNGGGGAVSVSALGTLNMYGGVIENNTATGYKGGALRISGDTAEANIFGGTIQNNSADIGGGIAFTGGTLNIKGKVNISGNTGSNLYVANDKTINIVDALDSETSIGITLENGSGKFTSGLDGKGAASNFTADASGNEIRIVNKEGYCGPPHTHSWICTADGDTITAVCSGVEAGTCDIETQTIRISAAGKVYDGTAVTATLTKSDGWTTDNSLATPEITYSGNTDAGTYTASITLGEATASAEFTIDEASMDDEVSAAGCTFNYDGNAHSITVTKPEGATVKYGTESGTYNLNTNPTYTNAGTYTVYYQVTKKNYITVTGSATVKINKINAVVTIKGNSSTVNYDGTEHTVNGYVANANTSLYDVSKDFTFSGTQEIKRTNAGTTYLELAPEQFENTNANFKTVTFVIESDGYLKVNQIDATVTIVGNTSTVDYDGTEHTLGGYVATPSTNLYDVSKDFTFSGTQEIKRTNAGTTYLELAPEQFENTNANFKTVTFVIESDGYLKVNQIDATVVITGHNETVGYDDYAHTVTGYDAQASTDLYDVTKDFTFSGVDECERTDVGVTEMQLSADQFENINPNFRTITFEITDGYIEVLKVDAIITNKPQRKSNFVYNGNKQTLATDGTVWGGTLYYALGKDDKTAPADNQYKTEIPSAKEIGNYYVWYKVEADSNHYSLPPVCLKVTLADKTWVTVSGTVYDENGVEQSGADVTLTSGNKTVDTIVSDANGGYYFTVPAGVYNIVTSENGKSQTTKVELYKDKKQDVNMIDTKTESIVQVNSDNDFGVVVDGLNQEAEAIRKADKLSDDQSLSLVMTVETKTDQTANHSKAFKNLSVNTTFMFFDVQLEKTVDSKKTVLKTSTNVIEIAVPYEKMNRKDIAAYYSDGSKVKKLKESKSKEAGTYWIDKENGIIYIYSNEFATFAIGYTPYYTLDSNVVLGSFGGNVNVSLIGMGGEGVYRLENVSLNKIGFANVPKGRYKMTVTWTDGVENTLTMPITVS